MATLSTWLEFELFSVGNYSLSVYRLLSCLLIVLGTWIIARKLSGSLGQIARRRSHLSSSQIYTFTRLTRYTLVAIGFLLALSSLGINFEKLAWIAGALGVGIGFGLQNIVSNFVSGIIILFEKSLRVGDFVELESGLLGEVREINIRSTLIRTMDNADILVPNSQFVSAQVNNWTLSDDLRRFSVRFGVAYGSDPSQVIRVITEAARKCPETQQEEGHQPAVIMTDFGDSSLNFMLTVWIKGDLVKRPGQVTSLYNLAIHRALTENNIEIPFPQRDIHIKSGYKD